MAHVNLHIAEGLVLGGALGAVPLARAWLADRPVSGHILRLALLSFVCAAIAAVLRLHDRPGGLLIGELVIAGYLVGLYLLILFAIRRATRRPATRRPRT